MCIGVTGSRGQRPLYIFQRDAEEILKGVFTVCRSAAQPRAKIQRAVAHVGACLLRQIRIQRCLKIIISLKPDGARKAKYGCIADR